MFARDPDHHRSLVSEADLEDVMLGTRAEASRLDRLNADRRRGQRAGGFAVGYQGCHDFILH